jgi:2-oxoglutarate dehydrogenase complex dehydrogenase (E1) component-like enzyme
VKYHLGASSDREFDGNKVHMSLTANPSHLEIVNPVVMGKARAKQDMIATEFEGDIIPLRERVKVMPLLLHGDAAFAGQGVVAEFSVCRASGVTGWPAPCISSSTTRSASPPIRASRARRLTPPTWRR